MKLSSHCTLTVVLFVVVVVVVRECLGNEFRAHNSMSEFSESMHFCNNTQIEGCYLKACFADDICKDRLRLRDREYRHNCFEVQSGLVDIITNKIVSYDDLFEICQTNSTLAAIILRLYQPCPLGYVYSASKKHCVCHVEGFCAEDIVKLAESKNSGKFALWFFGTVFLGLSLLAFYQVFKTLNTNQ
jgi:hypothetical protein